MKIPVNLSADHIKSLTVTNRPLVALAEVIWNGLDADANRVSVRFDRNKLEGLEAIRVNDDGTGINFDHAVNLFGTLGDSWKKTKNRTTGGRGLHGKNGKGRFRAFSLGSIVEWNTTAHRDGVGLISYKIAGSAAQTSDMQAIFRVGGERLNRRRGTARLKVFVPGPGRLTLWGKGLVNVSLGRIVVGSKVSLLVKAKGKGKRRLDRRGKAKFKAKVAFTQSGGSVSTQRKHLKLKERL